MKCIHCANDAKYSERTNGTCPKCGHAFAFEPKAGATVTDSAFQHAVERVSSDGTVKFTPRHVYYELARRTQTRTNMKAIGFGLAGLFFLAIGIGAHVALVATAILWVAAVLSLPSKVVKLTPSEFDAMWNKWLRVHGAPKGTIVRKELPRGAKERPLPSDIQHYSFDRAVIVDRPETVDLLLANSFHFENNCAVLSVGGYPEPAFDTVRAMLKRNPRLSVYVLHNATIEGCGLAKLLASDPSWFAPGTRVVDVGLRPGHTGPFRGLWQRWLGAPPPGDLPASERAWLSKYTLELAAIRPEQIIKRLFRAMSNMDEVPLVDGVYFYDSSAFGSDASASDGGGDSFG